MVDEELYTHLKSRNLTAELYAFPCKCHSRASLADWSLEHQLTCGRRCYSASAPAAAAIMTFSACTPPLKEVLHLFDFLLAYGCHLNILVVAAQLYLMRDSLLASKQPMALLRTFPPLVARQCIVLACGFLAELPEQLYADLARHPYDPDLVLD